MSPLLIINAEETVFDGGSVLVNGDHIKAVGKIEPQTVRVPCSTRMNTADLRLGRRPTS